MSKYAISPLLGQVLSNECPSREILEHLANKWSVLVLRCLSEGWFYPAHGLSGGATQSGISADHFRFASSRKNELFDWLGRAEFA